MNKWVKFFGLKALELCGVTAAGTIFYMVGRFFNLTIDGEPVHWILNMGFGAMILCLSFFVLMCFKILLIDGTRALIKKNMEWAGFDKK